MGQHNEMTKFELDRYRGRLIKQTGDGIVALFDGAARAVECAAAIARRVQSIGLEGPRRRAHRGGGAGPEDVRGVAVHLASRIMSAAEPGQVLVSGVTRELLAGSSLRFESRGLHALKGIDGERELFALAPQDLL